MFEINTKKFLLVPVVLHLDITKLFNPSSLSKEVWVQGNGGGERQNTLPCCWESAFLFSHWHSGLQMLLLPQTLKCNCNLLTNYFFPTFFCVWLKLYYISGKAHTICICAYMEMTIYYQTCRNASQFIYSWMALKLHVSSPSILIITMTAGVKELLVLFNCLPQEAFNKKK